MTFDQIKPGYFKQINITEVNGVEVYMVEDDYGGQTLLSQLMRDALRDSPYSKAVAKMREAQKRYFETRTQADLNASKEAERIVDAYLNKLKVTAEIEPTPKQGSLL